MNADIKKFQVDSRGVPRLTSVDERSVGVNMSTKSADSKWAREDVTRNVGIHIIHSFLTPVPHTPLTNCSDVSHLQYKYAEGSRMERRALYHGYEDLKKQTHDVTFTIPEKKFSFGEDVTLEVEMTNKAKQHVVKGTIECEAVTYTGKVCENFCCWAVIKIFALYKVSTLF